MKTVTGWHFAGSTLRDGRPLPQKGETLTHAGDVIPCQSGLHASRRAIDALSYAPGCRVARVKLSGTIVANGAPIDKYAASKRKGMSDYVDAQASLRALARRWAFRAVRVHAVKSLRARGNHDAADKLAAIPDDYSLKNLRASAADVYAAAAADAAYAAAAYAYAAADARKQEELRQIEAIIYLMEGE